MPSDEEFRELKDQVASLTSALATARRRIDDLEDGMADHLGLDWGESLVDVNSPHPNISANTIESGGGLIRQDSNGQQIATTGSLAYGIYFVDKLLPDPNNSGVEYAALTGYASETTQEASVSLRTANTGNDSATFTVSKIEDQEAVINSYVGYNGVGANFYAIGYADFLGVWLSGGGLQLDSSMSPTQLAANTNNYSPSGSSPAFNAAVVLRLSSDASRDLTGIVASVDGRVLILFNVGSFNIVLKNADANSSAANQFALKADITLAPGGGVALWYDTTSNVWRCFGSY